MGPPVDCSIPTDQSTAVQETPLVDIKSGDVGVLKEIRLKYPKNIIIGSLNINSLPNKLDALKNYCTKHD